MLRNKSAFCMHLVKCSTKFNMSFKGLYLSGSAPWLLEQPESAYNVAWFSKTLAGPKHSHDFISLDFHQPKDLCHLFLPGTFGVCFSMFEKPTGFFRCFFVPFPPNGPEVRNCPHLTAAAELDLKLELSSA